MIRIMSLSLFFILSHSKLLKPPISINRGINTGLPHKSFPRTSKDTTKSSNPACPFASVNTQSILSVSIYCVSISVPNLPN